MHGRCLFNGPAFKGTDFGPASFSLSFEFCFNQQLSVQREQAGAAVPLHLRSDYIQSVTARRQLRERVEGGWGGASRRPT